MQAPIGQQVIANGVLQKIDTLPYGHAVWHYRLDTPIPVYTMVVGIAGSPAPGCRTPAAPPGASPITVWAYPQDSTYAVAGRSAERARWSTTSPA